MWEQEVISPLPRVGGGGHYTETLSWPDITKTQTRFLGCLQPLLDPVRRKDGVPQAPFHFPLQAGCKYADHRVRAEPLSAAWQLQVSQGRVLAAVTTQAGESTGPLQQVVWYGDQRALFQEGLCYIKMPRLVLPRSPSIITQFLQTALSPSEAGKLAQGTGAPGSPPTPF